MVLEDVDLIAEERTRGGSGCATPLLFELLNEMDGLSDDSDVLFLLTTNRPALLEPGWRLGPAASIRRSRFRYPMKSAAAVFSRSTAGD